MNDNVGFSVANISILKKNTAESKFSGQSVFYIAFLIILRFFALLDPS